MAIVRHDQDAAPADALDVVIEARELLTTLLATGSRQASQLLNHPSRVRLIWAQDSFAAAVDGPQPWAEDMSAAEREDRLFAVKYLRHNGALRLAPSSTYMKALDIACQLWPPGTCWATIALALALRTPILTANSRYSGVGLPVWHPDQLFEYLVARTQGGGPRLLRAVNSSVPKTSVVRQLETDGPFVILHIDLTPTKYVKTGKASFSGGNGRSTGFLGSRIELLG
jgi:PIN domain